MGFYKTPEEQLTDMIASVQASGSQITDFNIGSGARTMFEAHAVVASNQTLILDQFSQDVHLETAVGDGLDAKGTDYLVPRNGAVQATGSIQITRPSSGVSVTLPAGWGQLQTQPAPGQPPVAFLTTQDAIFGSTDLTKTVSAIAVSAGTVGNIADQTQLYPVNPVSGFPAASAFKASGAFTNGVDQESDTAYRQRIKTTVQGRVNGTPTALLAAALGVPGVTSANVLRAGDTRADGSTVGAGNVEVYYAGSAGLLSAVQSACVAKSVSNQAVTVFTAVAVRTVAHITVWAKSGLDTSSTTTAIVAALQAVVSGAGVGQKVYYALAIEAIAGVPNIVAPQLPFADFRKFTDAGGTAADIAIPANQYANLDPSDVTVAYVLI